MGNMLALSVIADIMNTGTAHSRTFQFHRIKDCYRIDQSCSRWAPFNLTQYRLARLICPFKGK